MKNPLKFSGKRMTKDIARACKRRGLSWDESKYRNGSDYVTFDYEWRGIKVKVVYNTFNGTFIVKRGDEIITEQSTNLDKVGWYRALLRFIYTKPEVA